MDGMVGPIALNGHIFAIQSTTYEEIYHIMSIVASCMRKNQVKSKYDKITQLINPSLAPDPTKKTKIITWSSHILNFTMLHFRLMTYAKILKIPILKKKKKKNIHL
jgi:hypothetical protein